MIPQYAAASIVSLNKQLATPASVDSIPSSKEQEDHVSMGGNAATKTLKIIQNTERVLGIELFNAAQALEFRRPARTSSQLEEFITEFRKKVPFINEDKIMYMEIEKAVHFLKNRPE
jgi:histidine ammonia-lyase